MLKYYRCVRGQIEAYDHFQPEYLSEYDEGYHWIDLEDPTIEESQILEQPFGFHPLAIEDCLSDNHHPKIEDYDDYVFVIVHGIRFDAPTDAFVTRELDIFLGRNYLVTHHHGPMRSITATRELCAKGLLQAFPKGVDFVLHTILDQVFENYFPTMDAIEDKVQLLQVEVFENPTRQTLDNIFALKKDVLQLRRICTPQREIVNRLARGEFKVVSPRAAVYFRDIYDNLYRIVEVSYAYHDMAQSTLDAYLSSVSNRLNETMKRLTVIGALLMPLTLITGIYGMNFQYMPELHWRHGYHFVLALMVGLSGTLIWWFKKNEWI